MQFWRRLLLLFLVAAPLLSCGPRQTAGGQSQPPTLRAAKFGDTDPVDFAGRNPQSYPVQGIDASRYQGAIDWRKAADAGVSFAYVKATEGGDGLDPLFTANWRGAAMAGIPRGAFHFFYWCRPAAEQARWFIRHVPRSAGALPPVLDLEWTPFSPTCTQRPDGATVRSEVQIFLNALERHYGQRPIIYTSPEIYKNAGLSQLGGYEFWLRSTAERPSILYPGQAWTFWQYSSTGVVPGITGNVDLNAFAGSKADWVGWINSRAR